MSTAALKVATDSACAGWVDAKADRSAGLERTGARSAVDFDERAAGKKGEGRGGA